MFNLEVVESAIFRMLCVVVAEWRDVVVVVVDVECSSGAVTSSDHRPPGQV